MKTSWTWSLQELSTISGPTETIIDYTSSGSGQYGESLFPAGLEVYIDSDADVECLDLDLVDYDIDDDTEPELADSVNLATITGTEDRDVMVVGIE